MGWIKKVPFPHTICNLPHDEPGAAVGSIWQCDACGKSWEITSPAPGRTWKTPPISQFEDREQDR